MNPMNPNPNPQQEVTPTPPEPEIVPDRPLEPEAQPEPPKRKPRGFAVMDRKLVSEIARKGGKAAHAAGTAHEFTTEEARAAGRKGGISTHQKRATRTTQSSQ